MRYIKSSILIVVLLLTLIGCSTTVLNKSESSSTSENTLLSVSDNVCLREGTSIEGKVVISSKEIIGFYARYDDANETHQIVLHLTERGKELLSEVTTRLSKELGVLSLWIGNEKIKSPTVVAPITDGAVAIGFDEDSLQIISNKLQGK